MGEILCEIWQIVNVFGNVTYRNHKGVKNSRPIFDVSTSSPFELDNDKVL